MELASIISYIWLDVPGDHEGWVSRGCEKSPHSGDGPLDIWEVVAQSQPKFRGAECR